MRFGNGEADAVHANRAFEGDIMAKIGRKENFKAMIATMRFHGGNGADAVHMTLDEVTVDAAVGPHGAFEIDAGTWFEVAKVTAVEGFFEKIEADLVVAMRGDGQAATIDGDTVAPFDTFTETAGQE